MNCRQRQLPLGGQGLAARRASSAYIGRLPSVYIGRLALGCACLGLGLGLGLGFGLGFGFGFGLGFGFGFGLGLGLGVGGTVRVSACRAAHASVRMACSSLG